MTVPSIFGMTEARTDFINALLSGAYEQTRYNLYRAGGVKPRMCCLGVATDRYVQTTTGVDWKFDSEAGCFNIDNNEWSLPGPVVERLGVADDNPDLWIEPNMLGPGPVTRTHCAGECNDELGLTFIEIAYLFHFLFQAGKPFVGSRAQVAANAVTHQREWMGRL